MAPAIFSVNMQAGIELLVEGGLAEIVFALNGGNGVGWTGSISFVAMLVQGVWGWNPLFAGLGTMPWTGTIMRTDPLDREPIG